MTWKQSSLIEKNQYYHSSSSNKSNIKKDVHDIIISDSKNTISPYKLKKLMQGLFFNKTKMYKAKKLKKSFTNPLYAYQYKVVKNLKDKSNEVSIPFPH